jgi:pyroglutamyl-peptidase
LSTIPPIFITGFGPFGSFEANPSQRLAEQSGYPHQVLEVSFAAADRFLEEFDPCAYSALLMLGVSAKTELLRLESVAKNWIGATPDVLGVQAGPSPIEPHLPAQLGGTLWPRVGLISDTADWEVGTDAGGYLCNYLYFRALQRLPRLPVGFLHVPPQGHERFEELLALVVEGLAQEGLAQEKAAGFLRTRRGVRSCWATAEATG